MRSEPPQFKYGDKVGNYREGYIGFSYRSTNILSRGIVMFTEEEANDVDVSHSFYVVDEETIIEAEAEGVIISDPKKYFDDENIHVFFKKPINLSAEYAKVMTGFAYSIVGKSYDYWLIFNFLWQRFAAKIGIPISRKSIPLLDNDTSYTCSEVSASCLKQIKEYSKIYPLSEWHPGRISPSLLFKSPIFQEWVY